MSNPRVLARAQKSPSLTGWADLFGRGTIPMSNPLLPAVSAFLEAAATTILAIPLLAATAGATAAGTTAAVATTASAAITTATATAAARTTAEATWSLLTRTRFVDGKIATAKVLAVETLDGSVHCLRGVHADKGKATGAPSVAIHRKEHIGDRAVLAEEVRDFLGSGLEGEIPHIHFGIHR